MNVTFEDLDGLDDAPVREERTVNRHVAKIGDVAVPGFVENCPKCRGTGTYGRVTRLGHSKCTKCKGSGKLQFKTSPEARAKARQSAVARKQRKAEEARATFLASLDACTDVRDWLQQNKDSNSFAADLLLKGAKYGYLTEGQIGAVRKAIARDEDAKLGVTAWAEEHEAEYAWLVSESDAGNEFANSLLSSVKRYGSLSDKQLACVQRSLAKEGGNSDSDLDISGLKGYYAVPDGDTRLKLCVRKPGKNSRYYGWIFVDDGAGYGRRTTYGKQQPGQNYRGDVQDALRAILADPLAAQVAYGKLTGTCGHCGRLLEDEESVKAGIGPICAQKYA